MNIPLIVEKPLLLHKQLCRRQYKKMVLWLVIPSLLTLFVFYIHTQLIDLREMAIELIFIATIAGGLLLFIALIKSVSFIQTKRQLSAYHKMDYKIELASNETSSINIQKTLSEALIAGNTNHLISKLSEHYEPLLKQRMLMLNKKKMEKALEIEFSRSRSDCNNRINEIVKQVPLFKAKNQLGDSLIFLAKRRQEMKEQWDIAYAAFSWWNKFKYATGPNFADLDKAIKELETLKYRLEARHYDDFERLDTHFEKLRKQAIGRITDAKVNAEKFIQEGRYKDDYNETLLRNALWFSAMSIPLSIWADVDNAMNVFDALRGVNGNFSDMTDAEIWFESLLMPAESLAGLTALTKGAYFEQLVAADTSGQLHEHFNTPDTDILIDGVAFQIKATDSESYIYSVDESIPVIATSEVAATTAATDGGYSNEELTNTIDNALGGTIVDIGDTAADAVLAGLGGLGFFATIQGINHASAKYENGGDGVEALFSGAGVAIEGTASAIFGVAEMGYNVAMSRPSRFIGRQVVKGFIKLDNKLFGDGTNSKDKR